MQGQTIFYRHRYLQKRLRSAGGFILEGDEKSPGLTTISHCTRLRHSFIHNIPGMYNIHDRHIQKA